jgi:Uma2 family endonuclease
MNSELTLEREETQELASLEHGVIGMNLAGNLFKYVQEKQLGKVINSQTTYKVGSLPPKREPDVWFISTARMPTNLRITPEFAPEFAAEVLSETDSVFDLEIKVNQYLQAGVKLVWIIHPVSRTVTVWHPNDKKPSVLGIDDELDGETVIPGFKLKVKNLFE